MQRNYARYNISPNIEKAPQGTNREFANRVKVGHFKKHSIIFSRTFGIDHVVINAIQSIHFSYIEPRNGEMCK